MKDVTEAMLEAALETEFEGRTVRGMLDSALWHSGAHGNAEDVVRSALSAALKELDEGYKDARTVTLCPRAPRADGGIRRGGATQGSGGSRLPRRCGRSSVLRARAMRCLGNGRG